MLHMVVGPLRPLFKTLECQSLLDIKHDKMKRKLLATKSHEQMVKQKQKALLLFQAPHQPTDGVIIILGRQKVGVRGSKGLANGVP